MLTSYACGLGIKLAVLWQEMQFWWSVCGYWWSVYLSFWDLLSSTSMTTHCSSPLLDWLPRENPGTPTQSGAKEAGKNKDTAVVLRVSSHHLIMLAKKKKKSPKCDSAAKMILLLLHTICSISDSGCFELQKSELAIWDRSCFEPFKLWQDFSLLQEKKW